MGCLGQNTLIFGEAIKCTVPKLGGGGSIPEFERIKNFRTNRVPNMYSKFKPVQIEYRVITHSGKTIRIVFEYKKLLE